VTNEDCPSWNTRHLNMRAYQSRPRAGARLFLRTDDETIDADRD
jgi:hypothetical protein